MSLKDKIRNFGMLRCPVCRRKAIHAQAADFPLLDQENDFGYSLSVQCPVHGWKAKGYGWSRDELVCAGLKKS